MGESYRVFVHFGALEALPRSGQRRVRVLSFLKELGEIAYLGGDYVRHDPETGRPYQVSVIAGFAVTWWIDSPVREVKVVDIRRPPKRSQ